MTLTPEQRDRLARLDALPDEAIDTTDMPVATGLAGKVRLRGFRPRAPQPPPARPAASPDAPDAITLRLAPDLLAALRAAEGPDLPAAVERILREHAARTGLLPAA